MSTNKQQPRISPSDLEVLIHCYVRRGDEHPRRTAPAVKECIGKFLNWGVIENNEEAEGAAYNVTEKGEFWLDMILSTPLPISILIDPREQEDKS